MINVVAALLVQNNNVLVGQRPLHKNHGGLWEFPGGKIELNESPQQALSRELHEELQVRTNKTEPQPLGDVESAAIRLHFFIQQLEGIYLPKEHRAMAWLPLDLLSNRELCPNDREGLNLYGQKIRLFLQNL